MPGNFDKYLEGVLTTFDSMNLENEHDRRVAVKPLYDYFQILILEVAVHLCGLNRNSMKNCHLKSRWDMIKSALLLIEDPTRWDELINRLQNTRSSVEHNDYEVPSKVALDDTRKQAPMFKEWVVAIGQKYLKESKGFSFIQEYFGLSRWYITQAEWTLDQYGEKPPYAVRTYSVSEEEKHSYGMLESLKERLNSRIPEIHYMNDLKKEDLNDLVQLIKETERLDAKETVLLHFNVCPKCGGKVGETETSVGGSIDDPMPTAVIYRVGCEKCDYELHSETIDV